jgi:hypothetical protein
MKTKLIFEDIEPEELALIMNRQGMHIALRDILDQIFRPARKHGYSYHADYMNIEKWSDETHKVVEQLEQRFHEILNENDVEI